MSLLEKIFGVSPSPLLEACFEEVGEMLERSRRIFDLAIEALLEGSRPAVALKTLDDEINEGERRIRRRLVSHLSVSPGKEPIAVLTLAAMVHDAERVGDNARGLGEVALLVSNGRGGPFGQRLRQLSDAIRPLFECTRLALCEDDASKAAEVRDRANRLKSQLLDLTAEIAASDSKADLAVAYASASRLLRRITAHLSNIASAIDIPYAEARELDESEPSQPPN